jgi:hypothetical protein
MNLRAPDGSRLSIAIPPGQNFVEHRIQIGYDPANARESDVVETHDAICLSFFPEARCHCGIYDLEWTEVLG